MLFCLQMSIISGGILLYFIMYMWNDVSAPRGYLYFSSGIILKTKGIVKIRRWASIFLLCFSFHFPST